MLNKKNLPLYIALAVPVLMIILVAIFIYVPGIGKKPQYNFLYSSNNNVYYGYGQQEYQVSNGHLIHNPPPTTNPPDYYKPQPGEVHFYIYDVAKDQSSEITFEQAQGYNLDSSNPSPDGYTVQQGNGGGGDFLFGGGSSDYNSWFIKGHNRSRKLNLKLSGSNNYYNFQFLGWIE